MSVIYLFIEIQQDEFALKLIEKWLFFL